MFYLTNNYNNLVRKLCKLDNDLIKINIQSGGKRKKNNMNQNIEVDEEQIIKLLNDKDWETIVSLYKNPRDIKINGNNLLHLACTRGEIEAINFYLLKYPELFYVANSEGNTCAHLLAKYGHYEILKSLVKKFPEVIHFLNKDGDSLFELTIKEPQIMNWLINLLDPEYFKDMDTTKISSIKTMIELIKLNNGKDIYLHMIDKLISKGFQLNQPLPYYPLIVASKLNKSDVVDLLLKSGANPDIRDLHELSPLIKAVENKSYDSVKLLLEKGADINYAGPEGDHLPINIAFDNKDTQMLDILLDKKYNKDKLNFSFRNRNLDTPLHIALKNSQNSDYLKESDLIKLVEKTDLTLKNIKNISAMDLLKEYGTKKKIKIDQFINKEKKQNENIKKIKMPKVKNNNFGLFNSDVLHNAIYTKCILGKYKNVGIPTQKFYFDKFNKEFDNFNFLINFRTQEGNIIKDIITVYLDSLYELMPYLILWRSRDIYYYNENLKKSVKKLLKNKKIEFIFIKLSLIPNGNSTHANILIYNKKKNILERFEPYGYNEMLDEEKLNEFIEKIAKKIFNKNVKYINPKLFMDSAKFQIISSDSNPDNKKLGDPIGYCLAWTFWFLELRINNPDIDSKTLVDNALSKIINKSSESNQVLDYIRNYSQELDELKNKFLKNCGIKKTDYYNNNFNDEDLERILNNLKF